MNLLSLYLNAWLILYVMFYMRINPGEIRKSKTPGYGLCITPTWLHLLLIPDRAHIVY